MHGNLQCTGYRTAGLLLGRPFLRTKGNASIPLSVLFLSQARLDAVFFFALQDEKKGAT
jgi:hypothetical protein